MKKVLSITILSLLFNFNTYAEKIPDEYKLKDIGSGQKKLDVNFLCVSKKDKKDKIRYSYKKYKISSDNTVLIRLAYDDEYKVFLTPISPIIKYKNLKHKNLKKNEVLVDYTILGDYQGEIWVDRIVFVDPKNKNIPYYLFQDIFTLTKEELIKFNDLYEYSWMEIDNEDFFFKKTVRKKIMKEFIKRNNDFHKIIKESFDESDSPTLDEIIQPEYKNRLTQLNSLVQMTGEPTYTTYECSKK